MLTDLACRTAATRDKDYKLADSLGLYLFVTKAGHKSWRMKYRFGKKEKRLVFGPYPEVSLAQARRERDAARERLRAGVDPALEKRQRAAAAATSGDRAFRTLAEAWVEQQAPIWSERHMKIVRRNLARDVYPKIGSTPIEGITTPMVLDVLRDIERRGAIETAHRVRQHISAVFVMAIGHALVSSDPAEVTAKALKPVRRGRFPAVRSIKQARAVLAAVEARAGHPTVKLASRLLALTAVRSAMVRMAERHEFEDLDGEEPIWRIPASKMKLAQEQKDDPAFEFIVPLSRQAVETVKVAMQLAGGVSLIFRSISSGRKPISDSTISKAYRDADLSGIHVPHGWRSTFSTIMNELAGQENRIGDRAIIDLMLAHVQGGIEGRYNRAWYMPRRRELAQEWADMLILGLLPPDELLALPRH